MWLTGLIKERRRRELPIQSLVGSAAYERAQGSMQQEVKLLPRIQLDEQKASPSSIFFGILLPDSAQWLNRHREGR